VARRSFAREPEIIDFLSSKFGRYPFEAVGGIVDVEDRLGFALETQTRPVYSSLFFVDQADGDSVVVHELAHQWYGDSVRVKRWKHIWLNEGFATYAEWMWSAHEGGPGPAAIARDNYRSIPANAPFWNLRIGNPGPNRLFDIAVYVRGGMAVQALRQRVGDRDFFRILHRWPAVNRGGTGTTAHFVRLAERISDEQLDGLFHAWLFTGRKPPLPHAGGAGRPTDRLSRPTGTVLNRALTRTGVS
jgi:aminopeptidase N